MPKKINKTKSEFQFSEILKVAIAAALQGGYVVAADYYAGAKNSLEKVTSSFFKDEENRQLVTPTDEKANEVICKLIKSNLSNAAIISEESKEVYKPTDPALLKYVFVVDPLDGTGNFAMSLSYFVVSVGVLDPITGTTIAAAIYDPIARELYIAQTEGEAYLIPLIDPIQPGTRLDAIDFSCILKEKTALKCSDKADLRDANIDTEYGKDTAYIVFMQSLQKEGCREVRQLSSAIKSLATLCKPANFQLHGFVDGALKLWDIVTPSLLVRKSGGEIAYVYKNKHGSCDIDSYQLQMMKEYLASTPDNFNNVVEKEKGGVVAACTTKLTQRLVTCYEHSRDLRMAPPVIRTLNPSLNSAMFNPTGKLAATSSLPPSNNLRSTSASATTIIRSKL